MVKKTIVVFLYLIPIVFIFKNWFIFPFLSAHDFPYFFKETLADFPLLPYAWNPIGLGSETINYGLGIFIYFIVSVFVNTLSLSWELVYKLFIFGLYLFLAIISSICLLTKILKRPSTFQLFLCAFLFTANTYILMVVDGGQVGVALAYSVAPLVLARFLVLKKDLSHYQIFNFQFSIFNSLLAGLVLAVQVMFDVRIAFITLGIALLYELYSYLFIKRFSIILHAITHVLIGLIVVGLHASWVLPIFIFRSHPAQEVFSSFSSIESLRFFSFAVFSQTLSFLHPNWPENIFGKVGFMKPEFLLIPILAFSSLLFLSSKRKTQNLNNNLIFFVLLGLLGAFLTKGASPPFGEVNQVLFQYFPGMSMFRDPTKFYLLVALSYSILIPFSVYSIYNWLKLKVTGSVILNSVQDLAGRSRNKFGMTIPLLFLLFTILYFLYLIHPVLLNQLSGTFSKHEIPQEYILLKNFLHNQTNFSRTLWVPTQQRFNFYSYTHPALSADSLFSATNSADIIKEFQKIRTLELLSNLSIQYVIIPYDSFGEIFVEDRKYDESKYRETITLIDKIDWLKRIEGFGKIAVYEVSDHKDHFWLDEKGTLKYTRESPSNYRLEVAVDDASILHFTDSYSPYWVATFADEKVTSRKTPYNTNSFMLEKDGRYELTVHFSKEKYYIYGRVITLFFAIFLLFAFLYSRKKLSYDK